MFNKTICTEWYKGCPVHRNTHGACTFYTSFLEKMYSQLESMVNSHAKVLFVRFDLRFPEGFHQVVNNSYVSRLFKRLQEKSSYHGYDLRYVWVREQAVAVNPHYHCVALIDGNKVHGWYGFQSIVSESWQKILRVNNPGLVERCDRRGVNGFGCDNGTMIRRSTRVAHGLELEQQKVDFERDFKGAFYRVSYLAKVDQKDKTPPGVRRIGGSLLN